METLMVIISLAFSFLKVKINKYVKSVGITFFLEINILKNTFDFSIILNELSLTVGHDRSRK